MFRRAQDRTAVLVLKGARRNRTGIVVPADAAVHFALDGGAVTLAVLALARQRPQDGLVHADENEVVALAARAAAANGGRPRRHAPAPSGATVMSDDVARRVKHSARISHFETPNPIERVEAAPFD